MDYFLLALGLGAAILAGVLAYVIGGLVFKGQENATLRLFARVLLFLAFSAIVKSVVYPKIIDTHLDKIDANLQELSVFRTLKEKEPTIYKQYLDEVKTAHKKGATKDEVIMLSRAKIQSLLYARLVTASDEALINYVKTQMRVLKALEKQPGDACMIFVLPQQNSSKLMSALSKTDESHQDAILDTIEQVIMQQTSPQIPLSIEVEPVLQDAYEALVKKHGDAALVLDNLNTSKYPAKKKCKIVRNFYKQILKKNKKTSALVLRYLINAMLNK